MIRACGVLHNVAVRNAISFPPDLRSPKHDDPEPQPPPSQELNEQDSVNVSCNGCKDTSSNVHFLTTSFNAVLLGVQ